MKEVGFRAAALRTLRRMPRPTALRIRGKIAAYAADPASIANNVSTLRGSEGLIRIRVGDWRVIVRDEPDLIDVLDVMPRGKNYRP